MNPSPDREHLCAAFYSGARYVGRRRDIEPHVESEIESALFDYLATREQLGQTDRSVSDWYKRWRDLQQQALPVQKVEPVSFQVAVSRRLTEWAARILPAADRPDYAELFRSELYDLAQSGGGRWAQFAYAVRVLVRVPLLRRELRAPAREWSR